MSARRDQAERARGIAKLAVLMAKRPVGCAHPRAMLLGGVYECPDCGAVYQIRRAR